VRGKARQKKGEKRVWWRLSPGAGKAAALGFNFDNGDMPPMDSFGQGEERGKRGIPRSDWRQARSGRGRKGATAVADILCVAGWALGGSGMGRGEC
jgi:hypothetical protein